MRLMSFACSVLIIINNKTTQKQIKIVQLKIPRLNIHFNVLGIPYVVLESTYSCFN